MTNTLCLDENYSTTRMVAQEKPEIVNNPETVLFLPEGKGRKGEGGLRTKGYFKKSYKDKPLISVITVVHNGEKYLEQTIQSVLNQMYSNIEYIIIDGGSTDGTLDIIKKYEDRIDYWVSEPDRGISDAFNKGIRAATGEIIGIINADDWYENNALREVVRIFFEHRDIDVLCGELVYWGMGERLYRVKPNTSLLMREMSVNHPATFVRKDVYTHFGLFRETYRYAMDYELLLRFYMSGARFYECETVLANMRLDGVSDKYWLQAFREVVTAKTDCGLSVVSARGFLMFQILRRQTRRLIEKTGFVWLVQFYRAHFSSMKKSM